MTKDRRSLTADLGVLAREADMAMATIGSLRDDEIGKPTACDGWTRAHVIAHLTHGADALTDLATRAVTGEEPEAREADLEADAGRSAAELATALARADARLLEALRALRGGVRVETVPVPSLGEIDVYWLPAVRTAELLVHHDDLGTTWEWHEAAPDAIVDGIEVCVRRLRVDGGSPGLHVVAREGEEWTVGDGAHRIEGYYETLLPFLAREQVEPGLRHDGDLPRLPP